MAVRKLAAYWTGQNLASVHKQRTCSDVRGHKSRTATRGQLVMKQQKKRRQKKQQQNAQHQKKHELKKRQRAGAKPRPGKRANSRSSYFRARSQSRSCERRAPWQCKQRGRQCMPGFAGRKWHWKNGLWPRSGLSASPPKRRGAGA